MLEVVLERLKGLHPKVIDLALDRVLDLLATLGHPERSLPPVIHVAGTNGKGSTLAYLRAIIEAGGKSAHVYTSPHLVRFAERIRVAGRLIDDDALETILLECERGNDGRPVTFFEITTIAALVAFARQPADFCLLETGMGGRYDATNVIARPALTLLTPISLDHQAYLGDTVAAIAGEKAGILKSGVPCLTTRQDPEAMEVIARRAAAIGAPLLIEGLDWQVGPVPGGMRFTMGERDLSLPLPNLPGAHQIPNAGLALAAAVTLGLGDRPDDLARGVTGADWPARLQRLTRGPLAACLPAGAELWLDGGHNPSAGQALAAFIAANWRDRPLDLVAGMLDTKDSQGFFAPLAPLVRRMRGVAIPDEPHSRTADGVVGAARAEGLAAESAADVEAAVRDLADGGGVGRILICGSLYLAGTILADNG
ncbi:MAG: bifunctional folylpolyglutamate synthase/dihydrofolate synthase [Telmatospirillum sp.]|nr:bifunctional folylpolyglutamate synthase/dihydrofolate synthase [Telmatospirillum sp.]